MGEPMITVYNLLLSLGIAASVTILWKLYPCLIHPFTSPFRSIPGPPNPSLLYGNMKDIRDSEDAALHQAWAEKYGITFKYKAFFNYDRLCTMDPRALNHIFSHSFVYQKPELARTNLAQVLGKGLLVVEGDQHRQQRRIMNPAFGPVQIRELTEVFMEKAIQLRDIWSGEIAKSGQFARVDVLSGLSKMTLDVIGLAGFNYQFNALNAEGKPNELNQAVEVMFQANAGFSILGLLKDIFPPFRLIRDKRAKSIAVAQNVMNRIGMQLVAEKKAAILKAPEGKMTGNEKDLHTRDLLTLLIKANMATDIPESQRLSDKDMLAQIPTFLVAGHETTSNGTTWCLFALSQAPDVQQKLREELWSVPTENPTMDELMALPYLDAVIRETLRVHSPVPNTIRIAMQDDIIPLDKPYTDVHGQVHDNIKVKKDSMIFIPILVMNRSKALWGDDAHEFRPERWEALPEAVQSIPGVWGNMLSFLGGPRACIGYRFSLVEMKALIFTLVRAFEFELAVPPAEIMKKSIVVQRPLVRSEMNKGHQMPMMIKACQRP